MKGQYCHCHSDSTRLPLGNIQVWRHQEVPATGMGKYDTWWCQCWDRGGWSSKIWHDDGILWQCLQKHHKTLKISTRRYPDCYILHILNRYIKYKKYFCISLSLFLNNVNNRVYRSALQTKIRSTQDTNRFEVLVQVWCHQISTTH